MKEEEETETISKGEEGEQSPSLGFEKRSTFYREMEEEEREGKRRHRNRSEEIKSLVELTRRSDGESQVGIRQWIEDIELAIPRCRELDNEALNEVITRTVSGALRKSVEHFLVSYSDQENTYRLQVPWEAIKNYVRITFLALDERSYREESLKRITKRSGESMQMYNRRFLEKAQEAFGEKPNHFEDRIMAETYIQGLGDHQLAKKIIEDVNGEIEDMERVMRAGVEAQKTRQQYDKLCGKEKVSGVDDKKNAKKLEDRLEAAMTRIAKLEAEKKQEQEWRPARPGFPQQTKGRGHGRLPAWDARGLPLCFHCKEYGHMARDCWTKERPGTQEQRRPGTQGQRRPGNQEQRRPEAEETLSGNE